MNPARARCTWASRASWTLHLSGAGSVHANKVSQGLDATLSGAGGINIVELDGPVMAHVSGVGHIKAEQGHATRSGLGLRRRRRGLGGDAQSLDASISGFGGVRVKSVSGSVTKSVSGGGHVSVG